MSLHHLIPQLDTLRDDQLESADEMTWKVLYARRSQPLLVPMDPRGARRALSFFIRNPLLRAWGNALLLLDRLIPHSRLLATVRLERFPARILFGPSNFAQTALYCGFPGPLQKLTMYCPGIDGEQPRVVKIALQASADQAIAHEAHWLDKLGDSQLTSEYLPQLLGQGTLPCGRRYLTMLALPKGHRVMQFSDLHRNFLKVLARRHMSVKPWRESVPYIRLKRRMAAILPLIEPHHKIVMQSALNEVDSLIGTQALPACLVHSDFTPWNLGIADGRLFVFDWEYAEATGNPLQDFLHFHLMPRALQRWPMRAALMPWLVADAAAHGKEVFGNESGVGEASGALVLHYLLDTVTFYTEASGYLDPKHPVVRAYMRLLESRESWMPRPVFEGAIHEPGG